MLHSPVIIVVRLYASVIPSVEAPSCRGSWAELRPKVTLRFFLKKNRSKKSQTLIANNSARRGPFDLVHTASEPHIPCGHFSMLESASRGHRARCGFKSLARPLRDLNRSRAMTANLSSFFFPRVLWVPGVYSIVCTGRVQMCVWQGPG